MAVDGRTAPAAWRLCLRAMRPHQWVKNLLLFLPVLAAHGWADASRMAATLLGVAAFSLLASAAYVWNDLLDRVTDRAHPVKRLRPFASGLLRPGVGYVVAPLLALSGLGLAAAGGWPLCGAAAAYLAATLGYSLRLKREMIIDVLFLAGLYMWRVFAGSLAARVVLSPWLLAFSVFLFLSLALVKRYTELRREASAARGYRKDDVETLARLGTSSGYVAVLVLALYIQQPETVVLYPHPLYLWGACMVLIYWISRLWLLAGRGEVNEDPVLFAIRDRASYICAGAMAALALAAVRMPW